MEVLQLAIQMSMVLSTVLSVLGVDVSTLTLSCCGEVKVQINKNCLNEFSIGDRVLAVVSRTEVSTLEPFHYLRDEAVMKVTDCGDFTLNKICGLGENKLREDIIHYQLTPCPKQNQTTNAAAPPQVVFLSPALGGQEVSVFTRTQSCCRGVKARIDIHCLNRIIIGDWVLAEVNRTDVSTLEPFHFLKDEGAIEIKDCVDFTLQIICDENQEREAIVHHQLTPCPKQNKATSAAAPAQGLDLFFLLLAVLILVFR